MLDDLFDEIPHIGRLALNSGEATRSARPNRQATTERPLWVVSGPWFVTVWLAMTLDQQIVALVARFTDRPVADITPDLTLFDDLGLDGDDAVEFFEAFEADFQPDLEALYARWGSHFGPEGWTLSNIGQVVSGIMVLAAPVAVIAALAGVPRWLALFFGMAAFLVWFLLLRMWPFRPKALSPISVQDLITTAKAGRWMTGSEPALS